MAKTPVVGVAIKAKVDERALQQSQGQVVASTAKVANAAAANFQQEFHKRAGLDPSRLVNPAQFGAQGQRAGKAMGDSAADAIKRGRLSSAARAGARSFSVEFEKAARPRVDIDTRQTRQSGRSAGDEFADGFSGAGGLMRLAGKGGPIAGALIAAVGVAVKTIKPMIEDAMKVEASIAQDQSRLGAGNARCARFVTPQRMRGGKNSGSSIEGNVSTAVTAVQAGLAPDQDTITSLNTVSTILGVEIPPEAARSAGQLIRNGLANNAKDAFDIIVSGQREGLNVSGDWLDTLNEYSTQFRKLGLSGADSIGLLKQGLEGGARDTDKVADALKEFSIRAVDGSKQTTQAFEALGFNATDTADVLAKGGGVARDAFAQVLDRIRGIQDPLVQAKIAVALMAPRPKTSATLQKDQPAQRSRFNQGSAGRHPERRRHRVEDQPE